VELYDFLIFFWFFCFSGNRICFIALFPSKLESEQQFFFHSERT